MLLLQLLLWLLAHRVQIRDREPSSEAVDARQTGLWLHKPAMLQQQRFTRLAIDLQHHTQSSATEVSMHPCSIPGAEMLMPYAAQQEASGSKISQSLVSARSGAHQIDLLMHE